MYTSSTILTAEQKQIYSMKKYNKNKLNKYYSIHGTDLERKNCCGPKEDSFSTKTVISVPVSVLGPLQARSEMGCGPQFMCNSST